MLGKLRHAMIVTLTTCEVTHAPPHVFVGLDVANAISCTKFSTLNMNSFYDAPLTLKGDQFFFFFF